MTNRADTLSIKKTGLPIKEFLEKLENLPDRMLGIALAHNIATAADDLAESEDWLGRQAERLTRELNSEPFALKLDLDAELAKRAELYRALTNYVDIARLVLDTDNN